MNHLVGLLSALILGSAVALGAAEHPRIIFNNDGGDAFGIDPGEGGQLSDPAFELLRRRTTGMESSGVTTISYCTGWAFGLVLHQTRAARQLLTMKNAGEATGPGELTEALAARGTDPLRVVSEFCKANGVELWWSMRMNDTHDAKNPLLLSDFKKNHPDCLFGGKDRKPPRHGSWSGVDYSRPVVREFALAIISEVIANYAIDGIELDFFRHPIFFKSVAAGGAATDDERSILTEFMKSVRERLETHNATLPPGSKKLLLGIRCPDSAIYCRQIGLDLDAWLQGGLLDFCVFGGYFRLAPWSESAELARKYGVPSYASVDRPAVQIPDEPIEMEPSLKTNQGWITGKPDRTRQDLEAYRGRILSALSQGHQGVSFFNLFNPRHPIFKEIADVKGMARKPAKYFYMARGTQQSPSAWLEGGNAYFSGPIVSPGFPKGITPSGLELSLDLALVAVPFSGSAELSLDFTGTPAGAGPVEVFFNGAPVGELADPNGKAAVKIPPLLLAQGRNRITIKSKDSKVLLRDVVLRVVPS